MLLLLLPVVMLPVLLLLVLLLLVLPPLVLILLLLLLQACSAAAKRGILGTSVDIFRMQGPSAFVRGISPCLLRALPANGALFLAYEYSRRFLEPKKEVDSLRL